MSSVEVTVGSGGSVQVSPVGGGASVGVPAVTGVVSLNGLTGAVTLAVVGGTVSVAGSTITITVTGGGGGASSWDDLTGKPATFAPSAHAGSHATGGSDPLTLAIGQITGLQTALDGKQVAGSYAAANHGHAATAITYAGGPVGNVTGATVDAALNSIDADLENRISTTQFAASFSTGLSVADGVVSVAFGATSTTVCIGNDARLSNAREWSADTISQEEAEAGTATTRRAFTAQRVFQAIAAWWAGSAAKAKLDGIATGATANQTDAYLLSRANHTGTQVASTISDFASSAVAAVTWTTLTGKPTFAAVATSGSAGDLAGTLAYARMADATVTTPAQITSSQNNYSGFARGINRFTTDAARDLTGMVAGNDGEVRLMVNVGSFALTLKHQSASSTAANRFTVPWSGDCVISASGGSAAIVYDATSGTWRVL